MSVAISQPVRRRLSLDRETEPVVVEIGGLPIRLETNNPGFRRLIEKRYAGFLNPLAAPAFYFEIHLTSSAHQADQDVQVFKRGSTWRLERGDFRAELDIRRREGWIRQSGNPYSLDAVLRITHSLLLAMEGGFLLHAASAVRNGRAFLFAGVSGAGKTTIVRLAPADAIVLTDEVSYIRPSGRGYQACGTPFAGELARPGANLSAPFETLFFLEKAPANRIDPVSPRIAASALLRHILFFAQDSDLVRCVFDRAVEFVSRARTARLAFRPDAHVWELIG
jgi:hypothetical protein